LSVPEDKIPKIEEAKPPENQVEFRSYEDIPDKVSGIVSKEDRDLPMRERHYYILIDGWMRGLKPGHSESLLIDSPESVDPQMKMKPIWVTLKSDPEEPYKTRQIRCYIASDKEGVSRRQVFGGPSEIVSEIDREIDKQANPPLFDVLKEDLEELSERLGFKLPNLD
jgi:hypothetical protein